MAVVAIPAAEQLDRGHDRVEGRVGERDQPRALVEGLVDPPAAHPVELPAGEDPERGDPVGDERRVGGLELVERDRQPDPGRDRPFPEPEPANRRAGGAGEARVLRRQLLRPVGGDGEPARPAGAAEPLAGRADPGVGVDVGEGHVPGGLGDVEEDRHPRRVRGGHRGPGRLDHPPLAGHDREGDQVEPVERRLVERVDGQPAGRVDGQVDELPPGPARRRVPARAGCSRTRWPAPRLGRPGRAATRRAGS